MKLPIICTKCLRVKVKIVGARPPPGSVALDTITVTSLHLTRFCVCVWKEKKDATLQVMKSPPNLKGLQEGDCQYIQAQPCSLSFSPRLHPYVHSWAGPGKMVYVPISALPNLQHLEVDEGRSLQHLRLNGGRRGTDM